MVEANQQANWPLPVFALEDLRKHNLQRKERHIQQSADEWYYIRVNDVTAPTIAGAYQFKFRRLYSPDDLNSDGVYGESVYFPYQNLPVVLVKGEVDPAIMTGTIRYGGWSTTLYGLPVTLPGRVRAVGIADDPYTGKSLSLIHISEPTRPY